MVVWKQSIQIGNKKSNLETYKMTKMFPISYEWMRFCFQSMFPSYILIFNFVLPRISIAPKIRNFRRNYRYAKIWIENIHWKHGLSETLNSDWKQKIVFEMGLETYRKCKMNRNFLFPIAVHCFQWIFYVSNLCF